MKRSMQRILTTHTGSLPRPDELRPLLIARETHGPYDESALTGPVTYKDPEAIQRDVANFTAALQGVQPADTFMTAPSPGVIAGLLHNQYYPSYEAYLEALSEAMKQEYTAVYRAGFLLQIDAPDLASSRHLNFAQASLAEWRRTIALHIEVLNAALADIPPDCIRLHLCWGNYEGPHHRDVERQDMIDIALTARPLRAPIHATRTNGESFRR